MRALERTFHFLQLFSGFSLFACQVTDDTDGYRHLPSVDSGSCIADCDTEEEPDGDEPEERGDQACDYRTQTQGGWGTACHGDDPGCLRDQLFTTVYAYDPLVVGCDGGAGTASATLTSGLAVAEVLPTGGEPRALLPTERGPYDGGPAPKTVLLGQTLALRLNVDFDARPEFNPRARPVALRDLVVADEDSPCVGRSVGWVLAQADLALGGCASALTPTEANACATLINQSFVDGGASCSDDLALPDPRDRCGPGRR